MSPQDIHTGLSAFNNSYWTGIFYPEGLPASKRFQYYCEQFDTYEINSTFYKFPTVKSLKAWYDKSPEGFIFSVKAFKGITHYRRFNDCAELLQDLYATCREGLGDKLSYVLFQMPPSFAYSPERLDLIIASLDYSFNNVVEFRNVTWWRQDVIEALAQAGITFCSVSYPNLPEDIMKTTNTCYVRLHGVPKLFYSGYGDEQLKYLRDNILAGGFEKAFVYFNNTASNEGVLNAMDFKNHVLQP